MRISDWTSDVCSSDLCLGCRLQACCDFLIASSHKFPLQPQIGFTCGKHVLQVVQHMLWLAQGMNSLAAHGHELVMRNRQATAIVGAIGRVVDRRDRKSTRLNSSHSCASRMPYSA